MSKYTEQQLKSWKAKHENLFEIKVKDDTGAEFVAVCKKPDLKILGAAAKHAETDPLKSGIVIFDNCKLYVDEEINADDELKLAVCVELAQSFKIRKAELKKL